jgi:hypothetical protein
LLAVILLALLVDKFVFTSSGVKIELTPEVLRASSSSELEIKIYRSNLLGFKVPFGNIDVRFVIEEGANLVEIISESPDGNAKVRSRGLEGEIVIGIYSIKSGMQISRILIKILPRDLALLNCERSEAILTFTFSR